MFFARRDFDFNLPDNLIAQSPLERRDSSRLLCMSRSADVSEAFEHKHFYDLPDMLRPGDCLVLNDSRVLPARLIGTRETGGTAEVLLLCEAGTANTPGSSSGHVWECLVRPSRRIKRGAVLSFGNGVLTATVKSDIGSDTRLVEFCSNGVFLEVLESLGEMPLPPYIRTKLQDSGRYQTVYSSDPGSAAAPTAGLHFTRELLGKLNERGVHICYITLHVGLGTFRPVKADMIEDHVMHSERFIISKAAADTVNRTKESGGRVIAVGTTSCRALESAADAGGKITATAGSTDIFIYPGYKFHCIDGLITNFHLPESTLIMLVSAFASRERILTAYSEAIRRGYRFFSFGDAMMII